MYGGAFNPLWLMKAAELGILVPDGAMFRAPSPKLLYAGAELVKAGIPLDEMLDVVRKLRANVEQAAEDIKALMRERRRIADNEDDNFSVIDTKQIADTLSGTIRVMTLLLGAVAAISLLVGGIGIMNIMLVSVTERTREIGIRLAIGALEREVLLQFLIEAVALASLGGLVGLIAANLIAFFGARVIDVPFLFNPRINALAFLFAALVGVMFGYFPARRAALLDPIEALRYE